MHACACSSRQPVHEQPTPFAMQLTPHPLLSDAAAIAVVMCAGVSSSALTEQGIYAPTTQAFLNYCLLAAVFGTCNLLLPALRELRQDRQQQQQGIKQHGGGALLHSGSTAARAAANQPSPQPPEGPAGPAAAATGSKWARLRRTWPYFAALALIDVEANYLVTKAYQFTSLTSVTLLDCFTIPSVMLLSWLLLKAKYRPGHFAGAAACIAGLAVLVLGDSQQGSNSSSNSMGANSLLGNFSGSSALHGSNLSTWHAALGGSSNNSSSVHIPSSRHDPAMMAAAAQQQGRGCNGGSNGSSSGGGGSAPLLGDTLVLLGALLYAVCNVTQELLLADVDAGELLALLGLFGALISGAQAAALEHAALAAMPWSSAGVLLPLLGFAAAMFAFYSLVPQVLLLGGATVLNLSLLSSDGWAALARSLWFGGFQGWSAYFFGGSLLLVAGGLVVFTMSGSPSTPCHGEGTNSSGGTGGSGGITAVAGGAGRSSTGPPSVGAGVQYSRLLHTESDGDVEQQHVLPS